MLMNTARLEKAQTLINEARTLQSEFTHTPEPVAKDTLLLSILDRIPLFSGFLRRLSSNTSNIRTLANTNMPIVTKVAPFVGIALNALDFIQIPLIYFAAFLLGKKPPITLTNNARWLYAAVLLALCLSAFLIPVVAPILAIVSASLGLLVGTFTLGSLLYEYKEDKKRHKEVIKTLKDGPAGKLDKCILELELACKKPDENEAGIDQLMDKMDDLQKECEKQKQSIKALDKEAYTLKEKLKLEVDVIDHCIGITLSALALSGAVVSLFFPPAGLTILMTAAFAGTAYVMGRFAVTHFGKAPQLAVVAVDQQSTTPDLKKDPVVEGTTKELFKKFDVKNEVISLQDQPQQISSTPSTYTTKTQAPITGEVGNKTQAPITDEAGRDFKR